MHDTEDTPLEPAEMLELVEQQNRRVGRSFLRPIAALYLIWGLAWLAGFLLLWFTAATGLLRWELAVPVFIGLMVASIVASGIIGSRISRGVQGGSAFPGAVYGSAWTVSGLAFAAVGMGLISQGLSMELSSLYFPSAYALMVGILFMLGAALWGARSQLVLGLVLLAVGSVAPFLGLPGNHLLMAIGGGGSFLVAAVHALLSARKLR